MQIESIRTNIDSLRAYIDQQAYWLRQATEKLYEMEEVLFNAQDREYDKKYISGSIAFLKEAVAQECPPRQGVMNHCGMHDNCAAGFYQSDFDLKKIV